MTIPRAHLALLMTTLHFCTACGLECGLATVDIDGACVPSELACAAGTSFDAIDRQCRAEADGGVTCGAGTRLEANRCVPEAGPGGLSCGLGTVLSMDGTQCVPTTDACGEGTLFDTATRTCVGAASVTCGPGTAAVDGVCLPSADLCGPGTVFSEATGTCVRGVAFVGDCANPTLIDAGNPPRITEDTVLVAGGCFEVRQDITVFAALRIEPGVTIVFAENAGLRVEGAGSLSALGTEMAPIAFRGATAARGWWDGLVFAASNRSENALQHVTIEHGGGTAFRRQQAGLVLESFGGPVRIALSDLTIRASGGHGLSMSDATLDRFERVTIEDGADAPISVVANAVGQLTNAASLEANDRAYVDVRAGGRVANVTRDAAWPNLGVPYRVDGTILQEAQVILQPDTVVQMAENAAWYIRPNGSLVSVGGVQGTRIEGVVAEAGSWGGLIFLESDFADNILANTVVQHGGGVAERGLRGNVVLSNFNGPVRLVLRDVTLRQSAGYGLATRDADLTIERLTATANALGPMLGTLQAVGRLDANSVLTGNGEDTVQVFGQSTGSVTFARIGVPLRVLGDLQMFGDMVVPPGFEMRFDEGVSFEVWVTGSLRAIGTASEPIQFVGSRAESAWWTGLRFVDSDRADNRLEHVRIAHGGRNAYAGTTANLILRRGVETPRVSLDNVTVEAGGGAGVAIMGRATFPTCNAVSFSGVTPNVLVNGTPEVTLCAP